VRPRRSIFDKLRLSPGQLRAAAERRDGDAWCLCNSGSNDRANGAIYLGGFVIECYLKELLLERHSNLEGKVDPARLSVPDREVFDALWGHDLDVLLTFLPDVVTKMKKSYGKVTYERFSNQCAEWTIHVRYSPHTADIESARRFLNTLKELKPCLIQL
jgi:hypothetical protein